MGKLVTKQQGIFLFFLLILIGLAETFFHYFHLPAWPAFLVMVLFFVSHRDITAAPKILFGGAFGLLNLIFVKMWYGLTVPLFGGDLSKYTDPLTQTAIWQSKVIYIFLFVTLILVFKEVLPWIFNDFTFLMFLASAAVSSANTTAMVAAKAIAGTALKVTAETNPAAVGALQAALDKVITAMVPTTNVLQWVGIELIGGAAIIACMHGIAKLVQAIMMAGSASGQSADH